MGPHRSSNHAATVLLALSLLPAEGCAPPGPTKEEALAAICNPDVLRDEATRHLQFDEQRLRAVATADEPTVRSLLTTYGAALAFEALEGVHRPLNSTLMRFAVGREDTERMSYLFSGVSRYLTSEIRALGGIVEARSKERGVLAGLTDARTRTLKEVKAQGDDLALKLDSYPMPDWRPTVLRSAGNLISGAPTARNFQDFKAVLNAAMSALCPASPK